jgi:dTDP-4-dehydrorhamnose 3,5-epimerase
MSDSNVPPPTITEREVTETPIKDLYVITIKQVTEGRGTVRETFRTSSFNDIPVDGIGSWQQINVTETNKGAIRGMHAESMNKLVGIVAGEAFGAYVDLREDSPTKGKVFTTTLTKGKRVFVPKGVGNGFQSTSEEPSQYLYCFDAEWVPGMAGVAVTPLDPELHIEWPITFDISNPNQISQKDASAPSLQEVLKK